MNRNFNVKAPDRLWAGDITCIWTSRGWLYLAVILDLVRDGKGYVSYVGFSGCYDPYDPYESYVQKAENTYRV